jgi:hypothetical protein
MHRASTRKRRWLTLARGFAVIGFAIVVTVPVAARCDDDPAFAADLACRQIRESVRKVAKAERDEALALHMMTPGHPTPMAQTRLTELQADLGDLRQILRRTRNGAASHEASDCIDMGSQSLADGERLSRQIQEAMGEGDSAASGPPLKSGEYQDEHQLPEPPLPGAKSHEE